MGRAARQRRKASENSLLGDPAWDIRHLGPADAIMGYAGQASVLAGEPVALFVSTTSRSFRVLAFRMGWYGGDLARLVWQSGNARGHRQRKASLDRRTNTVATDWGPSATVPTHAWPEGSYLLRLDADSGAQRFIPLTIRSASTAGKVIIKNSVATWQAYNTWGGYDGAALSVAENARLFPRSGDSRGQLGWPAAWCGTADGGTVVPRVRLASRFAAAAWKRAMSP
jgi:hypothetical protein